MAMGSTAASDVPWASRWSMRMSSTSAGTIRIPPPTPNRPDRNPATSPTSDGLQRPLPAVARARTSDGT